MWYRKLLNKQYIVLLRGLYFNPLGVGLTEVLVLRTWECFVFGWGSSERQTIRTKMNFDYGGEVIKYIVALP
jgi:hypothetical protein